MYNIIDNCDYSDKCLKSLLKYEKGKCHFKIDYDRDGIGDTYSTLSNSFFNNGSVISDTEYCVDSTFDFNDYEER